MLNVKRETYLGWMSTARAEYEYYWSYSTDAVEAKLLLEYFGRYAVPWMSGGGVQLGPPYSDELDRLVEKKWIGCINGEITNVYWLTQRGSHVLGVGAWWGK